MTDKASAPGTSMRAEPAANANRAWMRALEMTARLDKSPHRLLASVVDEWAEAAGSSPALLSEQESFSYRQLSARAAQYGRWALDIGLAKGETVCLFMPNRPEYMAIWLGVTSVGGIVALLNTNLRAAALGHCIAVAEPKHLICGGSLEGPVLQALEAAAAAPQVWAHEAGPDGGLGSRVDAYPDTPLTEAERRGTRLSDPALLIYTSGTTGLPKAARVSHHRVMSWSGWFAGMLDAQADDRLYDCLPMYHSVGGVVATGALLIKGGSVVLREKFSARQFWDDVTRWDCTLFQYIGELCRFLLAAPPTAAETKHRLRMVCGNGLRPDVWGPFQERFHIPRILEFYAATEGNFSLYNAEGRPGSIGRIPPFMANRFPAALIRFDTEAGSVIRGEDGRCIRCAVGEAGEAIGRISSASGDPAHRFEGYTSAADSEKKILRDVFAPGDAWLRTGDLMRQDDLGFYYFVDRVGDTFRWKGENVATTEVAEILADYPGVSQVTVYGVAVPFADGKAGMAAMVVDPAFDLEGLHPYLADRLPAYARPVFLRRTQDLAVTETFKQKKADLARQGFSPHGTTDPLHVFDLKSGRYKTLSVEVFDQIMSGAFRL